jgi:asparaginyl-tRNA synthetase
VARDKDPRLVVEHAAGGRWRSMARAGDARLIDEHGGAVVWLTHFDHLRVPLYRAFADDRIAAGETRRRQHHGPTALP